MRARVWLAAPSALKYTRTLRYLVVKYNYFGHFYLDPIAPRPSPAERRRTAIGNAAKLDVDVGQTGSTADSPAAANRAHQPPHQRTSKSAIQEWVASLGNGLNYNIEYSYVKSQGKSRGPQRLRRGARRLITERQVLDLESGGARLPPDIDFVALFVTMVHNDSPDLSVECVPLL